MQVAERPQAIAVEFKDDSISYETLNRRANQLATHILNRIGADGAPNAARSRGSLVSR